MKPLLNFNQILKFRVKEKWECEHQTWPSGKYFHSYGLLYL